jgi:hypothetical protein
MEGLTERDLAYLASRGLTATEAVDLHGPTVPPSVYLHRFSRDGVLRWLWLDTPQGVPPGTPPVTQPADFIAELRECYGWEADKPVYGTDGGVLRLMRQAGEWILDNAVISRMSNCPATFVWRFDSLEQAIDAAESYFLQKAAGA